MNIIAPILFSITFQFLNPYLSVVSVCLCVCIRESFVSWCTLYFWLITSLRVELYIFSIYWIYGLWMKLRRFYLKIGEIMKKFKKSFMRHDMLEFHLDYEFILKYDKEKIFTLKFVEILFTLSANTKMSQKTVCNFFSFFHQRAKLKAFMVKTQNVRLFQFDSITDRTVKYEVCSTYKPLRHICALCTCEHTFIPFYVAFHLPEKLFSLHITFCCVLSFLFCTSSIFFLLFSTVRFFRKIKQNFLRRQCINQICFKCWKRRNQKKAHKTIYSISQWDCEWNIWLSKRWLLESFLFCPGARWGNIFSLSHSHHNIKNVHIVGKLKRMST